MFKNFKVDNSRRVTFSGAVQIPKSKAAYIRSLIISGKTTQVQTTLGKNLFDKAKATANFYVSTTNGNLIPSVDFYSSDYIRVSPSTIYFKTGSNTFALYTAAKVFISGSSATNLIITDANTVFVRFSIVNASLNTAQLELRTAATTYAAFVPNSPSPEYPSPLVSDSGFNLTSCGKNFLNLNVTPERWQATSTFVNDILTVTSTANSGVCYAGYYRYGLKIGSFYLSFTRVGTGSVFLTYYDTLNNVVGSQSLNNSGSVTIPANTYKTRFLFYGSTASIGYATTFANVQLELGTATGYKAYNGNTYPIRIEDTSGVLHEGNSLPDGTADAFNRDNLLFIESSDKIILNGSQTLARLTSFDRGDYKAFYYNIISSNFGGAGNYVLDIRASHFKTEIAGSATSAEKNVCFIYYENTTIRWLFIKIDYKLFMSTWVDAQTAKTALYAWLASNNVTILSKLVNPVSIPIKPYSPTFLYNAKPTQVEADTANIYTDAAVQPVMEFKAVSY